MLRGRLLGLLLCPLLLGASCKSESGSPSPADLAPPTADLADSPAADPCALPSPPALGPLVAGEYAVGGFRVTLGAGGAVSVAHSSDPTRALLAPPADRALVSVAATTLTVEDHQGSFSTSDAPRATCSGGVVDSFAAQGGRVRLGGGFKEPACAGVTFTLDLCEAAPGHLGFALRASDSSWNALTLRLASDAGERIFGLGEQFTHDTLDLKGRAIPVLAQEGGVGRGHQPISAAVNVAAPGSAGSEDSTYAPMPHYLTTRLRSLFLTTSEHSVFDFRAPERIEVRLFAPRMTGRVLYGESPLALIERYTEYAGRMPPLPDWANQGAIVALAKPIAESQAIVNQLTARGAAVAAVWNQTWSGTSKTFIGEQVLWNWAQNPVQYPGWDGFVDALAQKGVRVLCYVNPMLRDVPPEAGALPRNLYQEALRGGFFVKKPSGDPYLLRITAFDVGLLDLSHEGARGFMKSVIRDELLGKARCSGWMADFAEALPFDAVLASGVSAATYHNLYPVEWARLNREAITEAGRLGDVVIFNRSGYTRTPAYSLLLWEGDQLTTWDKYDGLVSAMHGLINAGLSGLSLVHSDTGGYTSLSYLGLGYDREAEQLKRWTEMSAFTAALRTHEGNQPGANAQVYSDAAAMDHFARFSQVYRALAFYRKQLFMEAQGKGYPLVRHLWLHYPDDAQAQLIEDQFLLGSEILVAPIKNKCFTPPLCPYDKTLYLPPGEWVHLWTGKVYGTVGAGQSVTVAAPIGQPAVFYRRGSAVGATLVQNLKAVGIDAR